MNTPVNGIYRPSQTYQSYKALKSEQRPLEKSLSELALAIGELCKLSGNRFVCSLCVVQISLDAQECFNTIHLSSMHQIPSEYVKGQNPQITTLSLNVNPVIWMLIFYMINDNQEKEKDEEEAGSSRNTPKSPFAGSTKSMAQLVSKVVKTFQSFVVPNRRKEKTFIIFHALGDLEKLTTNNTNDDLYQY